jgi:hypothetical protein
MNRRRFLIGAAVVPLISAPISLLISEDPWGRFLRELEHQVKRRLNGRRLDRLWIDPLTDGRRLVHLVMGGQEITFYQNYGG